MSSIDAEQFSLRWNNFHNNLTAGFHDLLLGEDLVDVTIAAEGKFVQAHKMVLSVCSPYFKDLFKVNPCKHPIVILKDTGYKELEALLQFMYRGEVNVRQEELAMFLKTAEMLQIKGLTGSDSKKESAEPTSNKTPSNSAPSRTHSLPQDTSTHPPTKRKRSEAPSTSAPSTPSQVIESNPQTPPEGSGNDQGLQDGNDFMQMMNPKMEPQEYDESEDGLDMMADDSVSHDPLVQQLLGGADGHKGNMAGLGNFVGLPGMKDGNIQDGGQGPAYMMATRYITCLLCGKMMRKASLRRHMEDRHMPNHRSHCPHCPKTFRTSNSLQNHLSLYHRNFRRKRMNMMAGQVDLTSEDHQISQQLNQQLNQHLSQQMNQQLNKHLNQQIEQSELEQRHQEQMRLELEMRRRQDGNRAKQDRGLDHDLQREQQLPQQQQQQQQQHQSLTLPHLNPQLDQYELDPRHQEQLRMELDLRRRQDGNRVKQDRGLDHDQQREQQLHQQQQQQSHTLPHLNPQLDQYELDPRHQEQLRIELDMRRRQDGNRVKQERGLDHDQQREQQLHQQQQQQQPQSLTLPPVTASLQGI